MSIIQKYIIKEFFKYFLIVQLIVLALFVTIDYLTRIGSFLEAKLSLAYGFWFVLLKTPYMITMLTPVSAILSFIVVFGLMGKNNEILALKSGGVSTGYLVKPVMIIGVVLTVFTFLIAETVVPGAQSKANTIKITEIKKKKIKTTKDNNIWLRKGAMIVHIKHYNGNTGTLSGISLYHFDESQYRLLKRTDAKEGVFEGGKWLLRTIVEQNLDPVTGLYDVKSHPEKLEMIDLSPDDLKHVVRTSDEMGYLDLKRYVKKVESEGYDATSYRVDLYAKFAFPFVCFVMSFIGAGIALNKKRSDGLPKSIAIGLGAAFLFWVLYGFCLSLGYGEMLPPLIAAWSANTIFLCVGGLVFLSVE